MEDYKIGRNTLSRTLTITVGNAATPILAASPLRTCLILGAPLAGTMTYLDQAGVTSGLGFNVGAGQVPIILTVVDEGELVTHQWWACADAAARVAAIAETNLAEM